MLVVVVVGGGGGGGGYSTCTLDGDMLFLDTSDDDCMYKIFKHQGTSLLRLNNTQMHTGIHTGITLCSSVKNIIS